MYSSGLGQLSERSFLLTAGAGQVHQAGDDVDGSRGRKKIRMGEMEGDNIERESRSRSRLIRREELGSYSETIIVEGPPKAFAGGAGKLRRTRRRLPLSQPRSQPRLYVPSPPSREISRYITPEIQDQICTAARKAAYAKPASGPGSLDMDRDIGQLREAISVKYRSLGFGPGVRFLNDVRAIIRAALPPARDQQEAALWQARLDGITTALTVPKPSADQTG